MDKPRWHRAHAGALHQAINIGIVPHVERACRPCPHGNSENRKSAQDWVMVTRRAQIAHNRRENHERHHARLHQIEIILPVGNAPLGLDVTGILAGQILSGDFGHDDFLRNTPPKWTFGSV